MLYGGRIAHHKDKELLVAYTSRVVWSDLKSADVLYRKVRQSQMTYRDLADEVERQLRKIAREEKRRRRDQTRVPTTCSHALISNLINGQSKSVHELRGLAIERALGVCEGDLFVSRVMRDVRTANQKSA